MSTHWRAWLQLALGHLRWPPAQFWQATPVELLSALDGAAGKFDRRGSGPGITRRDVRDMMKKLGVE